MFSKIYKTNKNSIFQLFHNLQQKQKFSDAVIKNKTKKGANFYNYTFSAVTALPFVSLTKARLLSSATLTEQHQQKTIEAALTKKPSLVSLAAAKKNLVINTKPINNEVFCMVKHHLSLPSKAACSLQRKALAGFGSSATSAKQKARAASSFFVSPLKQAMTEGEAKTVTPQSQQITDYLLSNEDKAGFRVIVGARGQFYNNDTTAKAPLRKDPVFSPPKQASKLQKSTLLLLKKGIHLGHKSYNLSRSRSSHPSMSKYLGGSRNSIQILDNEISMIFLIRALYIISLVSLMKGGILIINTHPDFLKLVKNRVSFLPWASSANSKWVGGTLTNWTQISKSIMSFAKFSNQYEKFLAENNITYPRYNKMKICFQGFVDTSHPSEAKSKYKFSQDYGFTNPVESTTINKKKMVFYKNQLNIMV